MTTCPKCGAELDNMSPTCPACLSGPTPTGSHNTAQGRTAPPSRGPTLGSPTKTTSNPERVADPTHCKYITVESPNGQIVPILFHAALQHRDAVPDGLRPVSAGYVMIYDNCVVIPQNIDSTTLNLGPKKQDLSLIKQLLNQ